MPETQPKERIGQRKTDRATPIVETRGLEKTYFGKISVPVLHGIDMTVQRGEFIAIIGQSGSGKSTLLNILGALDRPTGGTVRIAGTDIARLDDNELAKLRSETIGFIFQFHYLLDEFTCLENALMPITIRKGPASPEEEDRVRGLLKRVGLGRQLNQTPDTMSGGQNQRCAIVRALANEPRLILADEPTGNLDSRSGQEVFDLMREMNQDTGVAFAMVTHDDRLAEAADRILLIEDGLIEEVKGKGNSQNR
ncbi:MAG: ABC transporter ATP-binding protein [Armatimonadaceae bacterium]